MQRHAILAKYLPWTVRKDRERLQRVGALRSRDGDDCRRCRRPLRFDLPPGHDQSARIEPVAAEPARLLTGQSGELDQWCLTHGRCNPAMIDHTGEVLERLRRKAEAELHAMPRKRRRA
jgi:hypothetical protein